jgi:hypothetical protein
VVNEQNIAFADADATRTHSHVVAILGGQILGYGC